MCGAHDLNPSKPLRFDADIPRSEYQAEMLRHIAELSALPPPLNAANFIVALDIDGTIVDQNQRISNRLIEIIKHLRCAGTHICITTGRSVPATLPVVKRLNLPTAWIASANGAIIGYYTQKTGYSLVHQSTFNPAAIIKQVLEIIPEVIIGVESDIHGFRVSHPFPPGELNEIKAVEPPDKLSSKPASRVVLRAAHLNNRQFREKLASIDFSTVEHSLGWRSWLDINPLGTSKAEAFKIICQNLGVNRAHTIAIGDGDNDIEILKYAAYGVAMDIANPQVKSAANNTTLRVESDGATIVMEALARVVGVPLN